MKSKTGFFKTIRSELKRKILRPLYISDTLSILSVADSFYMASDYTENKDGFVAFIVNSRMVRAMLVDNSFLEQLILTSSPEDLKQMMFRLTDRSFRMFSGTKGNDRPMTDPFTDRELENWIINTIGEPRIPESGTGFWG